MDTKPQIRKGAILSYITIIITTAISFLYTPFLVKNLGQSEYGLYALVANIIGYLTILDFGFGNALVVYTVRYKTLNNKESEKRLHGMFQIVFVIIAIIITILGLILYLNIDNLFGKVMTNIELQKAKIMMLILTFNLAFSVVFSVYSSIITAYEEFVFQKIVVLLSELIKPIIMIPFLIMGYKSITMCIILTIVNISTVLSNYVFCKKKLNITITYSGFDFTIFKTIFSYSIWIFINMVVDKVNWSVDNFILGAVCGTIAVSVYNIASQLNVVFINISSAMSGLFLPKVSMMVAKNSTDEELTNEFIKVGRLQYIIIFLMASGLILFGKEFIIYWVGLDYEQSYYIALFLILPVCVPLIQNLGISILQAKNMHKFRSILYLIIALINIIISIPLSKHFGGLGAAFGTGLSLIVGNGLIMNFYYYKYAHINVIKFWKEIILMSVPFTIPIIIILILKNILGLSSLLSVIVFSLVYSLIYIVIAYKLSMNGFEKRLVCNLINKNINQ